MPVMLSRTLAMNGPARHGLPEGVEACAEDAGAAASATDGDDRSMGRVRCDLSTRRSDDPRNMLRFVVDAERRLVPDLAGRMPGRGFWVAADAESVEVAVKKRVFDRQAGGPVLVPADLPQLLERLLAQRCLDAIGLGRRSGDLISGFDQVAAVLATGARGVLIEASDAAAGGRAKLRARQGAGPIVASFTRSELGQALGRDAVVHAWLRNGRLASRLLDDTAKLQGFRRATPGAGEQGADEQQGI